MSSKTWLAAVVPAAILLAADLVAADRPEPQTRVVEEIVAKVNSEIITRGELTKQRTAIEAELQQQGLTGPALDESVKKRAADGLRDQIDQLLLVQKGKELNINVDADVNRRIAEIQSQSKVADPEKFHEWLREQTGETFEDFKLQMKNQLLTQRVIGEEVYRNVTIPRAELEKYYNEHKTEFIRQEMVSLREILVSVGDGSPEKVAAAEKKAKGLVDRARKGEKFPELARQYSDAPTATSDGDLGSFKRGDLRKEIEDVVFKQNKGYVSDPVRTPNGFEILRVDERYAAGQASFEEVQTEINNKLVEPRVQPKVRELLTQLRQNAFLQIKPGFVDSGAASGKDTSWQDPLQLRPETTTKEAVAARGHKKLLHVIPYGRVGKKQEDSAAPPPAVTPVPSTPVTPK
jgi:peptidyl-prolyl cis-trans isomerase SurA